MGYKCYKPCKFYREIHCTAVLINDSGKRAGSMQQSKKTKRTVLVSVHILLQIYRVHKIVFLILGISTNNGLYSRCSTKATKKSFPQKKLIILIDSFLWRPPRPQCMNAVFNTAYRRKSQPKLPEPTRRPLTKVLGCTTRTIMENQTENYPSQNIAGHYIGGTRIQ